MNDLQNMYDTLENFFRKQAISTGAKDCIYFEWSLNPKRACGRCADEESEPCKKFDGKDCEFFKGNVK